MEEFVWFDRKRILGLPLTFTRYYIRENRLYLNVGLFNTTEDELIMYRILDIKMKRTFIDKMFRVGTLILYTADETNTNLLLEKIKNPKEIRDLISGIAEDERTRFRLNGRELYGAASEFEHETYGEHN